MPPARFQVHASARVTGELQALLANAAPAGKAGELIGSIRRILEILAIAPLDFGEDRDQLAGLAMSLRISFVPPLVVRYGVNEVHRMVWIQSIRMLPHRA